MGIKMAMSPEAAHIAMLANKIADCVTNIPGNAILKCDYDEIMILGCIYDKVQLADKMLTLSKGGQ
jgi:hypothetical protein